MSRTAPPATSPRVVIDGRALTDGNRLRGIGVYVRELLGALGRLDEVDCRVLTTEPKAVPPPLRPVRMLRGAPARFGRLEHDLLLPLDIVRTRPEIFHSPALAPPRLCPPPWVLTVHDLIPLTYPGEGHEQDRAHLAWIGSRAQHAAGVIAVSRFCAGEAIRAWGLDPARVHVAPHGVDAIFSPAPGGPPAGPLSALLVSEYEPRKGYPEALEIVAALADRGLDVRLKIAGQVAPWVEPKLNEVLRRARRPDLVDLLGHVPHQRMPELYRAATVVLVTSRAEGFGLPALEAMACGASVVAFDNSATAEVVEGGGILVSDGDVGAATEAAAALLTDPTRRREVGARAAAHAAGFTWERSARLHLEVYRQAARSGT